MLSTSIHYEFNICHRCLGGMQASNTTKDVIVEILEVILINVTDVTEELEIWRSKYWQ